MAFFHKGKNCFNFKHFKMKSPGLCQWWCICLQVTEDAVQMGLSCVNCIGSDRRKASSGVGLRSRTPIFPSFRATFQSISDIIRLICLVIIGHQPVTVRASFAASCLCLVGKEKNRKCGLLGGSPQSERSFFQWLPSDNSPLSLKVSAPCFQSHHWQKGELWGPWLKSGVLKVR